MKISLRFLGASGTVTGSKYLLSIEGKTNAKILIDAGLFQGPREWRVRNWQDPARAELESIDAVVLTHAHIDHTGILPRYVKLGLRAPVYCSEATADLARLLLPDSAALQEEEARYRAKEGKSRHHPPLPLYEVPDAERALELLKPVGFDKAHEVLPGIKIQLTRVGHILGAAAVTLTVGGKVLTFSGDLGRYHVPILKDPQPVQFGHLLLIESTYGNRVHASLEAGETTPEQHLGSLVREGVSRGGAIVIPSFAVGRTQLILYYLRELKEAGAIPDVPIVVDSPMAADATALYRQHPADYDEEALAIRRSGRLPFSPSKLFFTQDREESKRLNAIDGPIIIISASGMLSGGRILHHLKQRISGPKNTILFVGYQPPGGRGAWIKSGADSLRLFGEEVPIRAAIREMSELSAHGDRDEMLRWCRESMRLSKDNGNGGSPRQVAVVHGEPDSAEAFAATLKEDLGWNTFVPHYQQEIDI